MQLNLVVFNEIPKMLEKRIVQWTKKWWNEHVE